MGTKVTWVAAGTLMLYFLALLSIHNKHGNDFEQAENLAASSWGPSSKRDTKQPVAAKTEDLDLEEGKDIAAIRVSVPDKDPERLRTIRFNDSLAELPGNFDMQQKRQKVNFLRPQHLDLNDMFAATWLQPLSKFMAMDVEYIMAVEDGCFVALRGEKNKYVRMTVDWLDFSVEHLSKWWKLLRALDSEHGPIPYNTIMLKLQGLLKNIRVPANEEMHMRATLAVIAFQPYKSSTKYFKKPEWAEAVTVTSLAATIASLMQAGFGRVVVVGHDDQVSLELSQQAFQLLCNETKGGGMIHNESATAVQRPISRIGHMEVGFVSVTFADLITKAVKNNIPKAALAGLQQAFKGDLGFDETKLWLGDHHYNKESASPWKYVYLTEPDTILQTRPWVLPQLVDALDDGFIIVPHRLQPLPHESDVKGFEDTRKFVPAIGNFSVVMELDALGGDVCCDAGIDKPGESKYPSCGNFWFLCGFDKKGDPLVNHERLLPYEFMRLRDGTGIVSLTGTPHGRRCNPRKNAVCKPDSDGTWTPSAIKDFME